MSNNLSEFFLADRTLWKINKYIRKDVKAAHLAKTITKLMHDNFSTLTLAQLDKKHIEHGFSLKFEISAISSMAMEELLGRSIYPTLDKQLIFDAWELVYREGVCPAHSNYQ
ncbi:hypothetical protein TUM3794_20470 [Shewanella colwelliana]|uniref:Uncharacterized protein n=1 Tax=Shewanella colwelliana TaxID=23 RepID=A0ABQ4P0K5_SHECO|nr:hypothetical protein [Shewanella colwelliana]GIU41030.1 hypothetical protein TUM3794_20470 [Shewanella colwelliana]